VFVVVILRFQKWFDVKVLDLQTELWSFDVDIFDIFGLATVLATFYKNWVIFFNDHLVTLRLML
jgi:hypothetical protein